MINLLLAIAIVAGLSVVCSALLYGFILAPIWVCWIVAGIVCSMAVHSIKAKLDEL